MGTIITHILKIIIKGLSCLFYRLTYVTKKTDHIPAAGKVLDQKEIYHMIDASLDMWLTTGRFNDAFESQLASFLDTKYVVTTNSGSSANLLAVTALTSPKLGERRLKKGDEVITVAAGFPTTITPIIQNGLTPVFVDVALDTYNVVANQIEEALTDKTKAIILAHTLGNPFELDKILAIVKKYNLWLIEDNCDALGSKYKGKFTGTFGHIATQSFYPAHHITMGEGGAVLTNESQLHQIIISYRDWGRDCWCPPGKNDTCNRRFTQKLGNLPVGYDHKYTYSHLGYNLKITDWQAAIGLAQLEKLPTFIKKREQNFSLLYEGLINLKDKLLLPKATENSAPCWFGFPLTIKPNPKFNKNDLVQYLEQNNIGTRQLFAGNILRQPAFIDQEIPLRIKNSKLLMSNHLNETDYKSLPNTDMIMNATFWVGLWPGVSKNDIIRIIKQINYFINRF